MIDRFGRQIDYLRISVTDRCNLRCCYCMPPVGIRLLRHDQILSFEEIIQATRTAIQLGITKIRLTGGEPLVRRGIVDLVRAIAALPGINDLAMTTNGILLQQYADKLAQAGLNRINISLDTMDPKRYFQITRGDNLMNVIQGIRSAQKAGLNPIKLNCVMGPFSTEADLEAVRQFGRLNALPVRFINQMFFETGCFSIVQGGSGGDCKQCSRLRLSSDGKVHPCLFSDIFFDIRQLGPYEAFRRAVDTKPKTGMPCKHEAMQVIGG